MPRAFSLFYSTDLNPRTGNPVSPDPVVLLTPEHRDQWHHQPRHVLQAVQALIWQRDTAACGGGLVGRAASRPAAHNAALPTVDRIGRTRCARPGGAQSSSARSQESAYDNHIFDTTTSSRLAPVRESRLRWSRLCGVLLAALLSHALLSTGQNLVTNPGLSPARLGGRVSAHPERTHDDASHGTKSGYVTGRTSGTWNGVSQSFLGVMQPGTPYTISAWVRIANTNTSQTVR